MAVMNVRMKQITEMNFYLQSTLTVCVETTFSVSCILSPWQMTTSERLFGSTMAVIFEIVIQPPGHVKIKQEQNENK